MASGREVLDREDVMEGVPEMLHDVQVDWVVEKGFAPLVMRCEGVAQVIPCELRRWSKAPLCRVNSMPTQERKRLSI